MFNADDIDQTTYATQSRRLRTEIRQHEERLTALQAESALANLQGNVSERFSGMETKDQRAILQVLVKSIKVGKHNRAKYGIRFDPTRLEFIWRYSGTPATVATIYAAAGQPEPTEADNAEYAEMARQQETVASGPTHRLGDADDA